MSTAGKAQIKLPASQLTLPGGFTIHIRYQTHKQITNATKEDCYGYWTQNRYPGGTIVLDKALPAWRKLQIFGHELVHAVHDYSLFLQLGADELRKEGEETMKELEDHD